MAFPKLENGMISGRLRTIEKTKIREALSAKGWKNPKCEICDTAHWLLGDYIVSPIGIARHPTIGLRPAPEDPLHPSFLLFCSNCGNTKLLNALVLGAFELLDNELDADA